MAKKRENGFTEPEQMSPEERLKFEIAEELGLADKIRNEGWRSLTAKESGRIGGLMTKKKRMEKAEQEKAQSGGGCNPKCDLI